MTIPGFKRNPEKAQPPGAEGEHGVFHEHLDDLSFSAALVTRVVDRDNQGLPTVKLENGEQYRVLAPPRLVPPGTAPDKHHSGGQAAKSAAIEYPVVKLKGR